MKKWNIHAFLLVLGALLISPAQATSVTFNLGTVFSDDSIAPDGTAPYATVVFDDGGTSGSVTMTLTVSPNVGQAILTELYINFDPDLDLGALELEYDETSTGDEASNPINIGTNAFQADGDGLYDILFDFPPPPEMGGNDEFLSAGEVVIYDIISEDAINANSFNFLSAPGGNDNGPFLAAVKFNRTGPLQEDSAWVGAGVIPVPAAVWLFGSGLIGLVGVARRRKK